MSGIKPYIRVLGGLNCALVVEEVEEEEVGVGGVGGVTLSLYFSLSDCREGRT